MLDLFETLVSKISALLFVIDWWNHDKAFSVLSLNIKDSSSISYVTDVMTPMLVKFCKEDINNSRANDILNIVCEFYI